MIFDSKQKLCDFFNVSFSRIDHLFNKVNMMRPVNIGSHRKPLYQVDDDYIKYFNKINNNNKVNKEYSEKETYCPEGNNFIKYLETRQKEIDKSYDNTHKLVEWI